MDPKQNKKLTVSRDEASFSVANPVLKIGQSGNLLIGGIPTGKQLPQPLTTGNYRGCLDGLEVNEYNVGPWNAEVRKEV